ncbi:MAG: Mut7-C RNAse domain-containing protein [Bacteroidales bacterium]
MTIFIRFYAELTDLLPPSHRTGRIELEVSAHSTIKDIIQSLGIPHTEVDLILASGQPAGFDYRPAEGDYISVYPVFESFDIGSVTAIRPAPLRRPAFIADVHLGKLARKLRLAGFDTLYDTRFSDNEIIDTAEAQHRIILTRDTGILKNNRVTHGCFIHHQDPALQFREILQRLDLIHLIRPLSRCSICNGILKKTSGELQHGDLPFTRDHLPETLYRCKSCNKLYWEGSHTQRFIGELEKIKTEFSKRGN